MSVRIRRARGGFTLLVSLPRGYVLRAGSWTFGAANQDPAARVRIVQAQLWRDGAREGNYLYRARGIHAERWNGAARASHLRDAQYARCIACGHDAWTHPAGTLQLVRTIHGFGYPRVTCRLATALRPR